MQISDTEAFALAVIQSSDSKLTIDEKILLYVEAKEKAREHNRQNPSKGGTLRTF